MNAEFGQLQFHRSLRGAPDRVFTALTSGADRMAWGAPDAASVVLIDQKQPAAAGLREMAKVGPRENPYVDVATDWVVVDAPTRLVYAETLSAEGEVLGTSLATFELEAAENGTQMRVTVQIVSFGGAEVMSEMESGWSHAMEALAAYV